MAAGPGLDAEGSDLFELVGIVDKVGMTADEDAPAFAHGLVDLIDLEADDRAGGGGERTARAGAEDDVTVEVAEVDRQRERDARAEKHEAADTTAGQVRFAL